ILDNPTAADRTVHVRLDSNLGSDSSTTVIVAPSETTNTYAVTRENRGESSDPALAHVVGGLSAAVSPDNWFLQEGDDDLVVEWTVTVPAGGRAILMHFAVQREPTDAAGAETQARALVDLSEPEALTGMSLEERADVVNFNVSPLLPGAASPRMQLVVMREGGWLRLAVRGTQGRPFVLEASSDLVHWTPLEAVGSGDGQIVLPELLNGGQSQRFYRARLVE
ncbi:MAG TPA: hypothetical protein VNO52_03280, partial [Methylomirabilota bacterium]|nr:hypothetical protein [Methylomirabilota bacterium]